MMPVSRVAWFGSVPLLLLFGPELLLLALKDDCELPFIPLVIPLFCDELKKSGWLNAWLDWAWGVVCSMLNVPIGNELAELFTAWFDGDCIELKNWSRTINSPKSEKVLPVMIIRSWVKIIRHNQSNWNNIMSSTVYIFTFLIWLTWPERADHLELLICM